MASLITVMQWYQDGSPLLLPLRVINLVALNNALPQFLTVRRNV